MENYGKTQMQALTLYEFVTNPKNDGRVCLILRPERDIEVKVRVLQKRRIEPVSVWIDEFSKIHKKCKSRLKGKKKP